MMLDVTSNTANAFRCEWSAEGTKCAIYAMREADGIIIGGYRGWDNDAIISSEIARLLTAWLIAQGFGPAGAA